MNIGSIVGKLFSGRNVRMYGDFIGKSSRTGIKTYLKEEGGNKVITSLNKDGSLFKVIKKDYFSTWEYGNISKEEGHITKVNNFNNKTQTLVDSSITTLLSKHTSWLGTGFGSGDKVKTFGVQKYSFNPKGGSFIFNDSKYTYNKVNDKSWEYSVHKRPQLGITKMVTKYCNDFENTVKTGFELFNYKTPSGKALKKGTIGRKTGVLYPNTKFAESIDEYCQVGYYRNNLETKFN